MGFYLGPRRSFHHIIAVLCFVGLFAYGAYQFPPEEAIHWLLPLVIATAGVLAGACSSTLLWLFYVLLVPMKMLAPDYPYAYTISPAGVTVKGTSQEGASTWQGIRKVRKSRSLLLFEVGGNLHHLVPRHAFDSDEAFEEYAAQAKTWWEAAQETA